MVVQLNGERREVADGVTVAGLLADLGLPAARVAVVVNEQVVPRDRHAAQALKADDQVELLVQVGGGD